MSFVQRPVPVQLSAPFWRIVITAEDTLLISTRSVPFLHTGAPLSNGSVMNALRPMLRTVKSGISEGTEETPYVNEPGPIDIPVVPTLLSSSRNDVSITPNSLADSSTQ